MVVVYVAALRRYATLLEHLLIERFIKEVYNLGLPKPKLSSVWEADILLTYLKHIRNDRQLNIAELSKKVTALLLLLRGLRIRNITTFTLRKMRPY